MSEDLGLRARAWLHMLSEGGRWSTRELAMDLGASVHLMQNELLKMYDAGSVARHQKGTGEERVITYSVADACRFPMGLTLADVRKALRTAGETV